MLKKLSIALNADDVHVLGIVLPIAMATRGTADMQAISDCYQLYLIDKELAMPIKYGVAHKLKCDITRAVVMRTLIVQVLDERSEVSGYCTVLAQKIIDGLAAIEQYRAVF